MITRYSIRAPTNTGDSYSSEHIDIRRSQVLTDIRVYSNLTQRSYQLIKSELCNDRPVIDMRPGSRRLYAVEFLREGDCRDQRRAA